MYEVPSSRYYCWDEMHIIEFFVAILILQRQARVN